MEDSGEEKVKNGESCFSTSREVQSTRSSSSGEHTREPTPTNNRETEMEWIDKRNLIYEPFFFFHFYFLFTTLIRCFVVLLRHLARTYPRLPYPQLLKRDYPFDGVSACIPAGAYVG